MSEPDQVPAFIREAGYAAYAWLTVDAELAELRFDSSDARAPELAGVRASEATVRALTYATPDVTIDLEIRAGEILGQVQPPDVGSVTVTLADGTSSTHELQQWGSFVVAPAPSGPFRLRIDGERPALTPWITI